MMRVVLIVCCASLCSARPVQTVKQLSNLDATEPGAGSDAVDDDAKEIPISRCEKGQIDTRVFCLSRDHPKRNHTQGDSSVPGTVIPRCSGGKPVEFGFARSAFDFWCEPKSLWSAKEHDCEKGLIHTDIFCASRGMKKKDKHSNGEPIPACGGARGGAAEFGFEAQGAFEFWCEW